MCEFHLKDNCFHPEKVQRGLVAIPCQVHDCKHCTNEKWQNQKIKEELDYHNNIIKLSREKLPAFAVEESIKSETKESPFTKIFK